MCGCAEFETHVVVCVVWHCRKHILDKMKPHKNIRVMFVESICDNEELLDANYRRKLLNDDYKGVDPEKALADFRQRVAEYEKVYQTVEDCEDDGNACYVKVYNVSAEQSIAGGVMNQL